MKKMENMINVALEAYTETVEETKQILSSVWKKITRKTK
jgi:hypothetical protein